MTKESETLKNNTDRAYAILQIRLQDFAQAQQMFMIAFQAERVHFQSLLDIQEKVVTKKGGEEKYAKKSRSHHQ